MTTPTDAARALQRLSAKTRWAKLSPEARAEVMRTVRRLGLESKEFDLLLTQPPKKQSATALKRARKPRRSKA